MRSEPAGGPARGRGRFPRTLPGAGVLRPARTPGTAGSRPCHPPRLHASPCPGGRRRRGHRSAPGPRWARRAPAPAWLGQGWAHSAPDRAARAVGSRQGKAEGIRAAAGAARAALLRGGAGGGRSSSIPAPGLAPSRTENGSVPARIRGSPCGGCSRRPQPPAAPGPMT